MIVEYARQWKKTFSDVTFTACSTAVLVNRGQKQGRIKGPSKKVACNASNTFQKLSR